MHPSPSSLSRAPVSLAWDPSLHLRSTSLPPQFPSPYLLFLHFGSVITLPSLTLTLLPPYPRNSCDYVGPTQIFQDNLPTSRFLVTSAESTLPCNGAYPQVFRIRAWTSLGRGGGHCSVYHIILTCGNIGVALLS